MKKAGCGMAVLGFALAALVLWPAMCLAQEATNAVREVVVPALATGAMQAAANTWLGKTFVLSTVIVTVVQVLKKILDAVGATWHPRWLVSVLVVVAGGVDAVADGKITPDDWVTMAIALAAGVGAYFGYKVIFRQPGVGEG